MRRFIWVLVGMLTMYTAAIGAGKGKVIELWPAERLEAKGEEKSVVEPWREKAKITKTTNVWKPTITVFRRKKPAEPMPAVVVCPGGGYGILAWDLEGTEICEWLNGLGIMGVLLKYRVPRQRDLAFQDAQRAVGLVRARAKDWGIDGRKIGILGFSAGGHLAARTCTNHAKRAYEPVDDADSLSCRPDFAVLIYPAYLAKGDGLDAETLPVTKATPTTFVAIASSDRFTPGALSYVQALRKAGVRSELHVFHVGGHGCGMRPIDDGLTAWPTHCERWLRAIGALKKQEG